jgi:hypothetical protein
MFEKISKIERVNNIEEILRDIPRKLRLELIKNLTGLISSNWTVLNE